MPRQPNTFTGRARRLKTRWAVRASDIVARWLITVGGIGTILAVSLVFLFLLYVVFPLFWPPAYVAERAAYATPWTSSQPAPVSLQSAPVSLQPAKIMVDEYQAVGWALYADGILQVFRLDTGETVERRKLFEGPRLTAASFISRTGAAALAFEDGTIRFGEIGFRASFHETKEIPALRDLAEGDSVTWDGGVVQLTPQGQYRVQRVIAELAEPLAIADTSILLIDHVISEQEEGLSSQGPVFCCLSADGRLQYCDAKRNQFTGEIKLGQRIDLPLKLQGRKPFRLLMPSRGDNVYLVCEDGYLARFDTRNPKQPVLAEEVSLLEDDARLTVCDFALGRETLLCGDSKGRLHAWFRVRHEHAVTKDKMVLTRVHNLPAAGSAVTSASTSQRSRMVAVGDSNGNVRVYHVTTDQLIVDVNLGTGQPVTNVVLTPKDDGLVAATAQQMWCYRFDPKHPEATLASLSQPVWYEGYDRPIHMWQSSFAGVEPEMKLGLWPLIFGTLKATFYTMLFGAPLALLAAVYTSEFVHPQVRAKIKPTIEMMASLPSVVLGFLAALVFAPFVERVVPATLACFLSVPVTFLACAYVWQLMPNTLVLRLERYRFLFIFAVLPVGLAAGFYLGPVVERLFFAGDMKGWLDGQIGTGTGGWMLLLLPLSAIATALLVGWYVNPILRRRVAHLGRGQFALINLVKFLLSSCFALAAALAISYALSAVGFDPRGSYIDTYVQRNALVVGFVMGFAVIPIIYTIAEDALTTVPQHLRSASLGAGATPWQTAIRVVIPTAMSGLFSALMIGLGRAVGETMIVLMAGGNTAVTDWNIFNGFRTLSANIAVELPEAVRDSTHYRTLFLAALSLFIMTFVVNTIAEIIRLRFRRRAYQL